MEYIGFNAGSYVFKLTYGEYDNAGSVKIKEMAKLVEDILGPKKIKWDGESYLLRDKETNKANWVTLFKIFEESDAVLIRMSF